MPWASERSPVIARVSQQAEPAQKGGLRDCQPGKHWTAYVVLVGWCWADEEDALWDVHLDVCDQDGNVRVGTEGDDGDEFIGVMLHGVLG